MIGDNTLNEDTFNTTQNIQGNGEGWVTIYCEIKIFYKIFWTSLIEQCQFGALQS